MYKLLVLLILLASIPVFGQRPQKDRGQVVTRERVEQRQTRVERTQPEQRQVQRIEQRRSDANRVRVEPQSRTIDRNRRDRDWNRNRRVERNTVIRVRTPRFRIYFPRLYVNYHFNDYSVAYNQGYRDGLYAGEDDAIAGRPYNVYASYYYLNSTRFSYYDSYRQGFVRGYQESYY